MAAFGRMDRIMIRATLPFRTGAEQTMAMPAIRRRWTAAQVRALIAESEKFWPRYELINGELVVTPAPATIHQVAVSEILVRLRQHLEQYPVGIVLTSPADLELQPDSIVQPDVFVVPRRDQPLDHDFTWADVGSLLLAVEVISPGSVRTDRVEKRDYYMGAVVDEYWAVDVDARMIERWRPQSATPDVVRGSFDWLPAGADEPLQVNVAALFRTIWSDYRAIGGR
jgi:Uma2 family endonuclease